MRDIKVWFLRFRETSTHLMPQIIFLIRFRFFDSSRDFNASDEWKLSFFTRYTYLHHHNQSTTSTFTKRVFVEAERGQFLRLFLVPFVF